MFSISGLKTCPDCPRRFYTTTMFLSHIKEHGQRPLADETKALPSGTETKDFTNDANSIRGPDSDATSENQQSESLVFENQSKESDPQGLNAGDEGNQDAVEDSVTQTNQLPEFESLPGDAKPVQVEQNWRHFSDELSNLRRDNRSGRYKKQSDKMLIPCDVCCKVYPRHNLPHHLRHFHDKTVTFKCEICSKEFKYPQGLQSHKKGVHEPKKCELCPKEFPRLQLMHHIRSVHTNSITPYFCDWCPRAFRTEKRLKGHLTFSHSPHDQIEPLQCDKCPKKCKSVRNLKRHEKSLHGIKPSKCNECHQVFQSLYELKSHSELVHAKSKSEVCEICSKKFTRLNSLTKHKRNVHEKIKPFKCEMCPFEASYAGDFKRHNFRVHKK